jgi:hypothetical protein
VERIESVCLGKTFAVWGLYSLGVLALSHYMSEGGWSPAASWLVAGLAGLALLVWTREI